MVQEAQDSKSVAKALAVLLGFGLIVFIMVSSPETQAVGGKSETSIRNKEEMTPSPGRWNPSYQKNKNVQSQLV